MRRTILALLAALLALPASAQDPPRVYELGDVETLPAVQNVDEFAAALAERYPPALRDSAIGGTAQVSFVIGADGTVREAVAVEATRPELGPAAVEAVSVLRFTPATVDGEAVDVRVTQPVAWTANPSPAAADRPEQAPLPAAVQRLLRREPHLADDVRDALELPMVTTAPRLVNENSFARFLAREYPADLRNAGIGGRVVVRFLLDRNGRPGLIRTISTTDHRFSEPTERAVRHLHFAPARVAGRPVPVWVELPIDWSIVP